MTKKTLAIIFIVLVCLCFGMFILNSLGVTNIPFYIVLAPIWIPYCIVCIVLCTAIVVTVIQFKFHKHYITKDIIDDR